jgi:proteasome-associated ATPase
MRDNYYSERAYNVIEVSGYEVKGEVVHIKDFIDDNRAIVIGRADEEMVIQLSEPLKRDGMKIGDNVLLDARSGYAVERIPKSDVEEVVLEEVPDVTYDDIGGLGDQIEALRDAIELPYLYPDEFKEHRLSPPKVFCCMDFRRGKTLIATAVANSLAGNRKRTGKKTSAYFPVKGPELLTKYVGETEHKIREVPKRLKKSKEDQRVVPSMRWIRYSVCAVRYLSDVELPWSILVRDRRLEALRKYRYWRQQPVGFDRQLCGRRSI